MPKLRDRLGRYLAEPAAESRISWERVARLVEDLRTAAPAEAAGALKELRRRGYTRDGLDELVQFGRGRGISDLITAADEYERVHEPPTSIGNGADLSMRPRLMVSRNGRTQSVTSEMSASQREKWNSLVFDKLLQGSDEEFLKLSVGAALAEARGAADE